MASSSPTVIDSYERITKQIDTLLTEIRFLCAYSSALHRIQHATPQLARKRYEIIREIDHRRRTLIQLRDDRRYIEYEMRDKWEMGCQQGWTLT